MMSRFNATLLCVLMSLFLAACSRELVRGDLTEDQANEISVALFSVKIQPTKELRDKKWQVSVPREDYGFALAVLQQHGLPRGRYQSGICDQFKKDGMISSGAEDRGRDMCAKSQDLETALRSIDGVISAAVSVSIPGSDPLADKNPKPSATALVKHRPNARIEIDKIRQMVRDSVSGLSVDNVSINLTEMQPLSRTDFQAQGAGRFVLPALSFSLAAAGLLAVGAGVFVWWRRRQPRSVALPSTMVSASGAAK
jgi:type III secretion protein J